MDEQNALVPAPEPQIFEGEIVDDDKLRQEFYDLRREYVTRIETGWQKSIDAIFEVGRLLIESKERLGHGLFVQMIANELPFNDATARKLMIITKDQRLLELAQPAKALPALEGEAVVDQEYSHVTPKRVLPASWNTLYELTQLTDDQFKHALDEGKIHANLERKEAIRLKSLPTGRADFNVRKVNQPPRNNRPTSPDAPQTSWDLASPLACESIDLEPAEVLILDLLYVEAVQ
ncbi:MAG: DUF3102 domain-containing protein, partial [Nitrospirae bacterium]|nr:DUF3102 domain-containing protein [Magnetococcales bacterium]